MKSFIFLISTVAVTLATPAYYQQYHGPPAPISHDGRVLDTPEVAHAKAAHLAAVAAAAAKVPHNSGAIYSGGYHGYSKPVSVGHQMYHSEHGYHGPPAPLDHEGRVIDTPEVARAKAAHLAAYSHVASSVPRAIAGEDHHSQIYDPASRGHGYHGPMAPLSHDGRVVDTAEVAHAKQAHLAAHANTFHGGYHGGYDDY